jgi:hypothetical protein
VPSFIKIPQKSLGGVAKTKKKEKADDSGIA